MLETGRKDEPLLLGEAAPARRRARWLLAALLVLQVLTGTLERVCFARMTAVVPHGIVLIHTMLAALSAILFMFLRLARSQSHWAPLSEQLQRVSVRELAPIAGLDALHSLLLIDGASTISGVLQAMLLQASATSWALERAPVGEPSPLESLTGEPSVQSLHSRAFIQEPPFESLHSRAATGEPSVQIIHWRAAGLPTPALPSQAAVPFTLSLPAAFFQHWPTPALPSRSPLPGRRALHPLAPCGRALLPAPALATDLAAAARERVSRGGVRVCALASRRGGESADRNAAVGPRDQAEARSREGAS